MFFKEENRRTAFRQGEATNKVRVHCATDGFRLDMPFRSINVKLSIFKSFCQAFFKKLAPVHRAERWSLSAESEIPPILPKRHERVNFSGAERGETHKWGFPLTEIKVTLC